jgi:hypothetical protein
MGLRKAISWRPATWDIQCGVDAKARNLAPGQTLAFTASLDASQPIRLAVSYRLAGADFTACSEAIHP